MNKSVKTGLRKLKKNPKDWPSRVNLVLRGMRYHKPRATKFSPYELLYGFQPRIIDENLKVNEFALMHMYHTYVRSDRLELDCGV